MAHPPEHPLLTQYQEANRRATALDDATKVLESYLPEEMTRTVRAETKKSRQQSIQLHERLKELRKTCKHHWVSDGHDSHYDWEKCTICGDTRNL